MIYLFSFVLSILILVFVHEFGHYYAAIKCGVKVEQFSIGFGKELYSFKDKRGTKWSLCLIPLGGYVRMYGDINPASLADHEFISRISEKDKNNVFALQPLRNRFLIVAAGPIMNYIFAIMLMTSVFFIYGKMEIPAVIGKVSENSAAFNAGIMVGDKIIEFDGSRIDNFQDLQQKVFLSPDYKTHIKILRKEEEIILDATVGVRQLKDNMGNQYKTGYLGISPIEEINHKYYNLPNCAVFALEESLKTTKMIFKTLAQIFTGKRSVEEIGGPVRIAKYSGDMLNLSIEGYIWFLAVMSVNLGFINLFPLPILDGGHLAYFTYEAFVGKPISKKIQEWGFKIGYIVVIFFTVLSFSNDIKHLLFK
jgi:regulator of sigma E protease